LKPFVKGRIGMKMRRSGLVAVAALALAASALAQGNPRGNASATVGGKKVTLDYGRPALKGRNLDELLKQLPPDRMWRAGENQVTTLTCEAELLVGGKKVPAGKYSVYVHAGEGDAWDFVLNKDPGVPLGKIWDKAPDNMKNEPWPHLEGYTKAAGASEIVRTRMAATKPAQPADLFTASFAAKGKGATLTLAWGTQAWSVDVQPAR
jgi:hypothetical protein